MCQSNISHNDGTWKGTDYDHTLASVLLEISGNIDYTTKYNFVHDLAWINCPILIRTNKLLLLLLLASVHIWKLYECWYNQTLYIIKTELGQIKSPRKPDIHVLNIKKWQS